MAVEWKRVITTSDNSSYKNSNVGVSDLGGGSGSTFLRKDGNWVTPTNTTYSNSSWTITSLSGFNGSTANFLRGDGSWQTPPDNNTTYSVGDGGLSQNNLTNALKSNYDDAYSWGDHSDEGYLTSQTDSQTLSVSGTTVSISNGNSITTQDTNTTYSVGDGGLTQKNFTSTLKTKLDGVATSANNYSHPTSAGNKHIPSGGGVGKFLKYDSSGVAVWAVPSYTTNTDSNTTYDMTIKSGSTKLNLYGNDASSDLIEFAGGGATVVTRTSATKFTISSTNTTYSVGDGGLTQNNLTNTLKSNYDTAYGWGNHASGGYATLANPSNFSNMVTVEYSDISAGSNRGFKLLNTSGTDQQWNITAGVTGSENESFCVRDSTAGVNALTMATSSGNATFNGALTWSGGSSANANTAYGWGNHASAGYLTSQTDSQTLSVSGTTVSISGGNSITTQDTNTTYSVGDGGLTAKNFTSTLKTKLDGIATSANNYTLPTASSLAIGGIKTGFSQSGKDYPVELNLGQGFVSVPWTNTTYSVGDGGLTQKNFTTTLKNKLDGIATGATNVTNNNQLTNGAGYITSQSDSQTLSVSGTTVSISGGNSITTQDTNTTYSVGDGGLTQKNFTTTLNTKLGNIEASADKYSNWNVKGGALDGGVSMTTGTTLIIAGGTNVTATRSSKTITISATNTTYSAGSNMSLSGTTFSATNTTYSVGDGGLTQNNFTDTLKTKLDGIATSANNYTHPTSAGNKHIPSGGSSGQFLRYSSSGTATWATPSYTTNTDSNTTYDMNIKSGSTKLNLYGNDASSDLVEFVGSGATTVTRTDANTFTISSTDNNTTYSVGDNGLTAKNFTSTLKTKLDGIASSANNYGFTLSAEGGDDVAVASGGLLNIESGSNATVSRSGTDIIISAVDTNTTYSAGSNMSLSGTTFSATNTTYLGGDGITLSGTTFNIDDDQRGHISAVGRDTNDYFQVNSTDHRWLLDGVIDMKLLNTGALHVDNDVIAYSTTTTSDKRLKTDISELQGNLDNVMSLEPVRFDWVLKDRGEDIGFIAQDVQKVIPEVVKEVNTIGETAEVLNDDTMLTIDYAKLVPVLVGAIQELKAEIDDLKRNK